MDLREVLIFAQVVRSGSFTAAARELGMQKSGVSRRVAALEERLGTRLLQRTTRSLRLTDEGRIYYEHCARALSEIEEAEAALGGLQEEPRGVLRVTAPLSFGFLGATIGAFIERHPEVQVELVCTDRLVDLVEERFDVAIRAGRLPDTSLIARKLGGLVRHLYASPAYLKRRKAPTRPEDLEEHVCLVFGTGRPTWQLVSPTRRFSFEPEARLIANDYDLLRDATLEGAGIALLPSAACAEAVREGWLVPLLPEWSAEEMPVQAVYPSTRHLPTRVRAFVDFLQERWARS